MPTISVRVDEASFKLVGKLATQLGRSKSWVVNDAIQAYLEHQRCMAVRTAKILDDLRNGRVDTIPHETAVVELRTRAARHRPK